MYGLHGMLKKREGGRGGQEGERQTGKGPFLFLP